MSKVSQTNNESPSLTKSHRSWYGVGLQTKGVLIIFYIVISAVLAGGAYYYRAVGNVVKRTSIQNAIQQGKALSLAAEGYLIPSEEREEALDGLAKDFQQQDNIPVPYIGVVDAKGKVIFSAGTDTVNNTWSKLTVFPTKITSIERYGSDYLIIAMPIISKNPGSKRGEVLGGIRLVVNTSGGRKILSSAERSIILTGAAIVFFAIPLGYILVWQFMVRPIRGLVNVTNRFAEGNYDVRCKTKRSDETGELAFSFNKMAGQVSSMRKRLIAQNAELEVKVADRTKELQKSNEQLIEAMSDKEQFLRAVSHDLNAPLRNIGGMATVIMMKWRDELPEDVIARLGRIQSNVDMQSSMLEELLELSRIKSQRQKRAIVDIAQMVETLKSAFEFELQQRNIELIVQGELPSLCVEANRLRQIFQNLIDNSIKYMNHETGGVITIGYRLVDGMHEFSVQDNGSGIPKDKQEQIFCVFNRGSVTEGQGVGGKGVGLAVVRSIVTNYDGKVWVESSPGEGASFFFTLAENATQLTEKMEVACV